MRVFGSSRLSAAVSAAKPKLDGVTGIIDQILADDQRMPAKQKHTAKRIFERLRDKYGFAGHYTIVKSYIHDRQVSAEGDVRSRIIRQAMLRSISARPWG